MNSLLLPERYHTNPTMIAGYTNYLRLNSPTRLVEEVQMIAPQHVPNLPDVTTTGILSYSGTLGDDTITALVREYNILLNNPVYSVIEKLINNYPDLATDLYPLLTLSPKDARDSVIKMLGNSLDSRIRTLLRPIRVQQLHGVYTSILTRHGRVSIHAKHYLTYRDEATNSTYVLAGTIMLKVNNGTAVPVLDWSVIPNAEFVNTCKQFLNIKQIGTGNTTLVKTDAGYSLYESSVPVDPQYLSPSIKSIIAGINAGLDYSKCSKFMYSVTLPDGTSVTIIKPSDHESIVVDSTGKSTTMDTSIQTAVEDAVDSMEESEFINENPFLNRGSGSDNGGEDAEGRENAEKEKTKKLEDGINKIEDRIQWIEDRIATIEDSDNHVKDDADIKDYYLQLKGELSILQSKLEDLKNKTPDREDIESVIVKDSIYESYTPTMIDSQVTALLENSIISDAERPYFLEDYRRLKVGLITKSKFYENYAVDARLSTINTQDSVPFTSTPIELVLPVTLLAQTTIDPNFRLVLQDKKVALQRQVAGQWDTVVSSITASELLSAPAYAYAGITLEYSIAELRTALIEFGVINPPVTTLQFIPGQYYLLTTDVIESETLYGTKGTVLQHTATGLVDGSREPVSIPQHLLTPSSCIPISTTIVVGNKYAITDDNGITKELKLINVGYSTTLDLEYTFISDSGDPIVIPVEDLVTCTIVPL